MSFRRKLLLILLIIFICMNVVAYVHAYKFTHFVCDDVETTKNPDQLKTWDKIKTLVLGVNNPRPENTKVPSQDYETIILKSSVQIEAWYIKTKDSKGTVIVFHGYRGEKSSMLDKSDEFLKIRLQYISC